MSDLIKRLRGLRIDSRSDDMAMIEAADALDAKDAEIARLRRLIDTAAETGDIYEQRLCEREAENERLRELLRGARNKLSGSYSNIELRDRIDATLAGTADQPNVAHYPIEFGPSDARRLECACGNADPAHAAPTPAPQPKAVTPRCTCTLVSWAQCDIPEHNEPKAALCACAEYYPGLPHHPDCPTRNADPTTEVQK